MRREGETDGRNEARAILSLFRSLLLSSRRSVAAEFAPRDTSRAPVGSVVVFVGVLFSDTRARRIPPAPRSPACCSDRARDINRSVAGIRRGATRGVAVRHTSAHLAPSLSLSTPTLATTTARRAVHGTMTAIPSDDAAVVAVFLLFFGTPALASLSVLSLVFSVNASPRCHRITKRKAEDREDRVPLVTVFGKNYRLEPPLKNSSCSSAPPSRGEAARNHATRGDKCTRGNFTRQLSYSSQ